jgi:hypothetical protein
MEVPMITASLRSDSRRGEKRFWVEISKTGMGGEVLALVLARVFRRGITQGSCCVGAGVNEARDDRVLLGRETHGVDEVGVKKLLTTDL